jgi:hypothetical protein
MYPVSSSSSFLLMAYVLVFAKSLLFQLLAGPLYQTISHVPTYFLAAFPTENPTNSP